MTNLPDSVGSDPAVALARRARWRRRLEILGPIGALVVAVLVFSLTPGFLAPVNGKFILVQTVIVAVAALGMTLVIVSGGIDLSVGSVVAVSGVMAARAVQEGWPWPVVLLVAVLGGVVPGLMTGATVAYLRLSPFIVTLGMMGMARGAAKWLADNQTVNYPSEAGINRLMNNPLTVDGAAVPLWLPPPGVLVALVLAVLTALLLSRTVFGRRCYAVGSNAATARLCGIRVRPQLLAVYALAGALAGVAGLLQMSRLQQGSPTVAMGLELDVIAAVVIGGASLAGGSGSVLGTIIGALLMSVLRNGTQLLGWPNYFQEIMIGLVIVIAVGLDRWRRTAD